MSDAPERMSEPFQAWTPKIDWIGHDHGVAVMAPTASGMWVSVDDYRASIARTDIAAAEVLRLRETEAALRAEVERLRPWAELGRAVMDGWPNYGDLDGGQLQDLAEKAGVLVPVEGGYNPEIHGDADYYDASPGDDWFTMIPPPAALGDKEARE